MSIVQVTFDIPRDIEAKIITGEYKIIGGIVRRAVGPNRGKIVKHLKPIDLQGIEQPMIAGKKMIQFAKNNKKALVLVGAVAGALAVGNGIYRMANKRESGEEKQFRIALKEYIFGEGIHQ